VGASGCGPANRGGEEDPRAAAARNSVLLITLDTFRADRAGCMGNPAGLTPTLDRLARRGLLASHAFAPAPLTAVSHASILTGLDPPRHGVRDNWSFRLRDDVPTLATRLGAAGYHAGGFIAGFPLKRRFGFAQGFEHFDDLLDASGTERSGDRVVESALAWIRALPPSAPWFLWTHFFDPHYPWKPPHALQRHPIDNAYDEEIVWTDLQVGRLFQGLEEVAGDLPLIALVTDHGEGLGGHGEVAHGTLLYQETSRAIFCMAGPAGTRRGDRISSGIRTQVARLTDVVPTLLDVLEVRTGDAFDGASILRDVAEPVSAYSETYYPEFHFGWSPLHALRTERWAYIDSPDPELFDLRSDPGETRSVLTAHPDVAEDLSRLLKEMAVSPAEAGADHVTGAAQEQLMALGYVGGSGPSTKSTASGKDPKKLVSVANDVFWGVIRRADGDPQAALMQFRHAYQLDPENKTVLLELGNCYQDLRDSYMALSYYQRTVDVAPQAAEAYMKLASLELARGRKDVALGHLEEGLRQCPGNVGLLVATGDFYRDEGRSDDARREYDAALEIDPHNTAPWIAKAELAEREGRPESAAEAWSEVEKIDPHEPRLADRAR
jgi:arylsulfatase A-like enzyme/Tfp pilus assembly protein PilF